MIKVPELPEATDESEEPNLEWFVLKVQSGREDTIRDGIVRRIKMEALDRYFDQVVVPTEKSTEIRNNKKKIVERKSYPGYIMIHMELNEKTWFLVRETSGVGDFVGAYGSPSRMTEIEVNRMLGQSVPVKAEESAKVKIDLERGDRAFGNLKSRRGRDGCAANPDVLVRAKFHRDLVEIGRAHV